MSQIQDEIKRITASLPCGVRLVAVSKYHPESHIEEAYAAGQRVFGESHVQELRRKYDNLPKDIEWHFIGHLQTNKVKYIIEDMDLIHSVDSIKLATEIDRHAARVNKVQDILIEVNVGGEASKSGIAPEQLEELLHEAGQLSHVHVRGLMTIPPVEGDEKFLYKMQQLYLDISSKKMDNIDMEILSMGMSGDFAAAIRYGSTLVRIGTALFGARNYQK